VDRLSEPRAARYSTAVVAVAVVACVVDVALNVIAWSDMKPGDAVTNLASPIAGVLYVGLGALIVRRSGNLVGWILQGVGFGLTLLTLFDGYGVVGILSRPGSLPGARFVGALAMPAFALTAIPLGYLMFVFPTGRLPSERWRSVMRVGLAAAALVVVGIALDPARESLPAPGGISLHYPNPIRVSSPILSNALVVGVWIVALSVAAAFGSLVVRYRSGGREARQQIKWIAFVAAAALLLQFGALISHVTCGCGQTRLELVLGINTAFVVFIGVPAAIAIAILKYGLYEIDVIINRAIVYAVVAGALTLVYVGVVVGVGTLVGSHGSGPTIVAAVAIALLFQPLRARARLLANRLVYGERATPYQVLSEFADRMAGTFSLEDVLERTAAILGTGTGATRVDIWLRSGSELRSAAVWPTTTPAPEPVPFESDDELPPIEGATRAAPVRHGDELLGALSIQKPVSEPLTPTEDKLLADLASQAGLVLRNVRLTADLRASLDDLRASRRRLVEAQDLERRKIERNLHDGAQQQLVALTVQLGLLERVAEEPERVKTMSAQIRGALGEAIDNLRDLARGIYPPLLADQGLAAAIDAQARKAPVPTIVEANGLGRFAQDVEAAVYF